MQSDFHYHGTYVLARLSGFSREDARRIAAAAQFVDDLVDTYAMSPASQQNGKAVAAAPTSHGIEQLRELNDRRDQIRVWIPFHFLPGGHGQELTDRLICQPDSPIAIETISHAVLQCSKQTFGLELLGVAAHAYADTFAHFGFCGVSSRLNWVIPESVQTRNGAGVLESISQFAQRHPMLMAIPNFRDLVTIASATQTAKSFLAQAATGGTAGALGHGAVATHPDAPFLTWSYEYQREDRWGKGKTKVRRDNIADYLRACERLLEHFSVAARNAIGSSTPVPFSAVRDVLEHILTAEQTAPARAEMWRRAAASGQLPVREEIPAYEGPSWKATLEGWASASGLGDISGSPAYRFVQAADMHRNFVLGTALPRRNMGIS